MLELRNIHKEYPAGTGTVQALKGVSLRFRKSEFVSILGPSGCGKTTMLNIIGGLDQYTDGDLIIRGKSTRDFKDRDWDTYRNHSIGFVFQSYNLIPHQTVLQNVELALTLSGVGKAERRARAVRALEDVGLGDQLRKKPSEMSGGQMQRVAIARAIVNDPDIILADEPTGALDTETSVQVMEILKKIASDRLVIMVTHNPDLAEQYSTRIIRMLDGRITGDSDPVTDEEDAANPPEPVTKTKKPSMSFFTAFGLSLKNLFTKKGRTTLTAFAGSIGIIGIALIYAVSQGISNYIAQVQEDTLSSYPISIVAESVDMSSMITSLMGVRQEREDAEPHEEGRVYSSTVMYDLLDSMMHAEVETNDLRSFKTFLDEGGNGIADLGTIRYGYNFHFDVYTQDTDGNVVKGDVMSLMQEAMSSMYGTDAAAFTTMGSTYGGMDVWEELLPGADGEQISDQVRQQYDLLYGHWPTEKEEVVLFVDKNNELSDLMLYALGYLTNDEMNESMALLMKGEMPDAEQQSWSYSELCENEFKMILPAEYYQKDALTGGYTDASATQAGMDYLYHSTDIGLPLRIVAIARPNKDATSSMVRGAIGYTSALTSYAMEKTQQMEVVKSQLADPATDVLLALPFATGEEPEPTAEEKAEAVRALFADASADTKSAAYVDVMSQPTDEYVSGVVEQQMQNVTRESVEEMIVQQYAAEMGVDAATVTSYIAQMSDEELFAMVRQAMAEQVRTQYAEGVKKQMSAQSNDQLAMAFGMALDGSSPYVPAFTEEQFAFLYDGYMPPTLSESTYERTLRKLGYVDLDDPSSISIYAVTFADKDEIADLIHEYNSSVDAEQEITYTDYVALLMSSVTSIINAITYVLIAFVAVSLIVSSIMIGVITLISVQERTKEIGILRAIGASKKNVSSMFNAETVIIGFTSGLLGVVITYLLCIPINLILHRLTGIGTLSAHLPVPVAIILVAISVCLTLFSGIIPSRSAAKKDPVVALRTE